MGRGRPAYDFRRTVGVEVYKSIRSVLGLGRYFRYHSHTRAPELLKEMVQRPGYLRLVSSALPGAQRLSK